MKTFTGFGFGAIQAGLMLIEAHRAGRFDRLVVAEIMPEIVERVRRAGGRFNVNIAERDGIIQHAVDGVEIYNPTEPADREALLEALAVSDEIATALPGVDFFTRGEPSVADLIAETVRRRRAGGASARSIIYTAENNNYAAEALHGAVADRLEGEALSAFHDQFACLNTVIGKMSGVVRDPAEISAQSLEPTIEGWEHAFLVEAFNHILISRVPWPDFERGIPAFEEKDDLIPFEEAKLYGHNATHALLGYLALWRGLRFMSDCADDADLMRAAREAFLDESGRAMIARHAGKDELFTEAGYRAYAEDLLERMVNPHLRDRVERITRDAQRKLAWNDRLVGTMRAALQAGIEPRHYAEGAAAALAVHRRETGVDQVDFEALWPEASNPGERDPLIRKIKRAEPRVPGLPLPR